MEVVHVVDPASVTYSIDPTMTGQIYQQMYDQTMANAKSHLLEICSSVGISQRFKYVAHSDCVVKYLEKIICNH